ncbi:hypothetical protein BDY19DRAFT_1045155 [Irpex rosettiformis]|uniref:Uncharacterized protein n=1 Tax=Irpex rosettiformis TaxID=378272 RepID=A0ACB8UHY2_9APHY|nr:hypothetical protein BDY19DRAFT_1045155 [Irpex rosettiformis]
MPRSRKPLKQKSLLDFVEPSSPSRPARVESGPSRTRRTVKGKGKPPTVVSSSPRMSGEESGSKGSGTTSSDVGAIGFESKATSDDEDVVQSPRRPILPPRKARKRRAKSVERSSISINSDSEGAEPVGVPVVWKKKGRPTSHKRKLTMVKDSDEEEDDDEPQPRRRKLVKGVRPPSPGENTSDLLEEVDSNTEIIEDRFRARGKKSAYEKNLEKLKKRKLKQNIESSASESEGSEEEGNDEPFAGAKPHKGSDLDLEEPEDEDLSGFIEEDSINAIAPELPAEFSMSTYQDLMHHFKIICQLFVHLAVQDPEQRRSFMEQSMKDQYFSMPLQIARRKLAGMKDSSVTSSVWKTPFKKALETYPDYETLLMDFTSPGCDACNLGGRLSTIIGRVSGEPYDRTTFEPLNSSDSDEEDDDGEEDGSKTKQEFTLGRFCARRTRVFHRFTHWEYALFKSLAQEVNNLKSKSTRRRVFVPVAYAGGTRPPDDLSDADGIMNWLDERGVISSEWHKIKEMMDSATNLEVASKRGEGDD